MWGKKKFVYCKKEEEEEEERRDARARVSRYDQDDDSGSLRWQADKSWPAVWEPAYIPYPPTPLPSCPPIPTLLSLTSPLFSTVASCIERKASTFSFSMT